MYISKLQPSWALFFFTMADYSAPNDILYTILRSVQSKGKELPLQLIDIDEIEDTISKETGVSRPHLDSLFVKCGILKRRNKNNFRHLIPNPEGITAFVNHSPDLQLSINKDARAKRTDGSRVRFTTIKIDIRVGNSVVGRESKRRKKTSASKCISHFKKDLKTIAQEFETETYNCMQKETVENLATTEKLATADVLV